MLTHGHIGKQISTCNIQPDAGGYIDLSYMVFCYKLLFLLSTEKKFIQELKKVTNINTVKDN